MDRYAATDRLFRSWNRRSAERAGTSSRFCGAANGIRFWSATPKVLLVKRMGELVDGEYQKLVVSSGAYVRQHFFGNDRAPVETGGAAAG